MNSYRLTKLIAGSLVAVATTLVANSQTLIAAWDFQTTTNGGTASVASSFTPSSIASPLVYVANFGSGSIYLNGTNGSSTWLTGVQNPEVTSFAGSSVNTAAPGGITLSAVTTGTTSLALANSSANGKFAVFSFSMTGFSGLTISYSTQATSTGYNLQTWEYSADSGTSWQSIGTYVPRPGSTATTFTGLGIVTISSTAGLDNVSNALVRLSLAGSSSTGGNNRLDNIQFVAAVPEPSTYAAILGCAVLAGAMVRRRRSSLV